ncbi:hypothetical protein J1N35_007577 [Gossypium stocksii]|uniref:Uncharacterized protein n=1 Tax=Gossypium stocksii TaxID=47602 RepID=A0A9D3W6R3_9ROSI|nr:hypothetical protein J1N35_007577 [Gossypium stocksii]
MSKWEELFCYTQGGTGVGPKQSRILFKQPCSCDRRLNPKDSRIIVEMEKESASGKEMATVTMGFEHVTTIPKFKRRKVSTVRDFLPGCERGATTDLELHRQIVVDQGKYSLSISK